MYQALDHASEAKSPPPLSLDWATWPDIYIQVSGADQTKQAPHAKILERVPANSLFTILEHDGQSVACGFGVMHKSQFGIFDIATRKQNRQLAHGYCLVENMLAWAYAVVFDQENRIAAFGGRGTYFLPGGGCESSETLEETLDREIKKECGVEVRIEKYIGEAIDYVYSPSEESYFEKRGTFFACSFRTPPTASNLVWIPVCRFYVTSGRQDRLGG